VRLASNKKSNIRDITGDVYYNEDAYNKVTCGCGYGYVQYGTRVRWETLYLESTHVFVSLSTIDVMAHVWTSRISNDLFVWMAVFQMVLESA
jgi:hypothetical protein